MTPTAHPLHLAAQMIEGRRITVLRATCTSCGAHIDERQPGDMRPQLTAKRLTRRGWDLKLGHARVLCPSCCHKPKPRKEPPVSKTPDLKIVSTPKPATPDQKAAIRRLLDSNFDDARGCYLSGYSDQRIGEELQLPWSMVREIRELAYGPIKEDPDLAAIRQQIVSLQEFAKTEVAALQARIDGQIERLNQSYAELRKRLGVT